MTDMTIAASLNPDGETVREVIARLTEAGEPLDESEIAIRQPRVTCPDFIKIQWSPRQPKDDEYKHMLLCLMERERLIVRTRAGRWRLP